MRKLVLLDIDGVLLNLIPILQKYIKHKYNIIIEEEDVVGWDWDYCLGFPEGLTSEFWEYMWSYPAKPYPGAIEFVRTLKSMGYFVQGVSARPSIKTAQIDGARAAARDFPQFGLDNLVLAYDKVPIINKDFAHAEFMVEDSPKNAAQIGYHTPVPVLLMNRPWNTRCISVVDAWTRVHSYTDILNTIGNI